MLPQIDVVLSIQFVEPPGTSIRMDQISVSTNPMTTNRRSHLRQYQARRRLTTSSSFRRASSVPNKLGQGMKRRKEMSISPRKAMTATNVITSDHPIGQSSFA
jgi:hypothetical protein